MGFWAVYFALHGIGGTPSTTVGGYDSINGWWLGAYRLMAAGEEETPNDGWVAQSRHRVIISAGRSRIWIPKDKVQ